MKVSTMIASALILLLATSFVSASQVKVLTADNFDSVTASGIWFIKLYVTSFERISTKNRRC